LSKSPWAEKSKRHSMSREEEYVAALRAALGIWYAACNLLLTVLWSQVLA
jgi:hypothetical protein